MVAIVLSVVLAMTTATPAPATAPTTTPDDFIAGVTVSVEPDELDSAVLQCRVVWSQSVPSARVAVQGLEPGRLHTAAEWTADDSLSRLDLTIEPVTAGHQESFALDLSSVENGQVVVIAEASSDDTVYQRVVRVTSDASGISWSEPSTYRISHVRPSPVGPGSTLVECLDPPKTLGEIFNEDHANAAIAPDGHDDCDDTGGTYPLQRFFDVRSAPAGVVVSGYLMHVTVSHPVMSDLHVGFFKGFGAGNYLWRNQSGVNLDRDYTRDIFNRELDGIGTPVNDLYILGVRDCVAGDTGTLDYWSLRIDWEDPDPTIDLVADDVDVDPDSIEVGDSLQITYSGHVAGTGTVGGPFSVGIYLSTDSSITTADTLLTQRTESAASNPGDSFGVGAPGLTVALPGGTAAGSYWIGLIVDDNNAIDEANESNNTETDTLTVSEPVAEEPDLEAVQCSVTPSTVEAGDGVVLTWRGRNRGTAASDAFTWGVYLSTDSSIDPGSDTLLVDGTVPGGWAAGFDSGNVSQAAVLPSPLGDGTYRIGMYLDSTRIVAESNENNNWCTATLEVSTEPDPPAATRWLIPAAASAPGFGTSNWKTQIEIVNPTSSARAASVYFVAKGAAWPGTLLSGPIDLAALQARYLDDPLLPLSPTTGLLYVDMDAAGPVVTSRTYNLADGGATYGQGIPAIALSGALAPTTLVLPMAHSIPGLFHTNLGLVQTSAGSSLFEVIVYSTGGSLLGIKNYPLNSAYDQVNDLFTDLGIGSASVEGAWIVVRLLSGSPSYWTCYASVVDDLTGDPTYVAPVAP